MTEELRKACREAAEAIIPQVELRQSSIRYRSASIRRRDAVENAAQVIADHIQGVDLKQEEQS